MKSASEIISLANKQILEDLRAEIKPVDNSAKIANNERIISNLEREQEREIDMVQKSYADKRKKAIVFFKSMDGFDDIESFRGSPRDFSEKYRPLTNSLKSQYYNLTQAGRKACIDGIREEYAKKKQEYQKEIQFLKEDEMRKPDDEVSKMFKLYEVHNLKDVYFSSKVSKDLIEEVKKHHIKSHEVGEKRERFGYEMTPHTLTFSDGSQHKWDE